MLFAEASYYIIFYCGKTWASTAAGRLIWKAACFFVPKVHKELFRFRRKEIDKYRIRMYTQIDLRQENNEKGKPVERQRHKAIGPDL